MSERKTLTKMVLEQRAPASGRVEVRDKESPLVFRLTANGSRSLCVRTRIAGEQTRLTYPQSASIENLSDARQWARQTVDACKNGGDPREAKMTSEAAQKLAAERAERLKFENAAKVYLDRRVRREKQNRTADEIERQFNLYFLPRWRGVPADKITRGDVNELLDEIFDKKVEFEGKTLGGPVAADKALAQLRAFFNWLATKDDQFVSPIVKGMARTNPKKRERDRVLADDEIRAAWKLAPSHGTFGAILQTLLLSAQRRNEVSRMARSEQDADGVWTIPPERYKTDRPIVVPLSANARAIIAEQDQINKSDFVFTTNGETPFSGFGKCKDRFDAEMLSLMHEEAISRGDDAGAEKFARLQKLLETALTGEDEKAREEARELFRKEWWILHDLRRTAKTLMSRAGVRPDISERVLGHVIDGVEGVYDRHAYLEEKRVALEKLAGEVDRIIAPPANNVLRMAG
jgi:integrase